MMVLEALMMNGKQVVCSSAEMNMMVLEALMMNGKELDFLKGDYLLECYCYYCCCKYYYYYLCLRLCLLNL